MEHAKDKRVISQTAVHDFQALPGNGLSAVRGRRSAADGGSRFLYAAEGNSWTRTMQKQAKSWQKREKHRCSLPEDHTCAGMIAVADTHQRGQPAGGQRSCVNMGIRVVMLTGRQRAHSKSHRRTGRSGRGDRRCSAGRKRRRRSAN